MTKKAVTLFVLISGLLKFAYGQSPLPGGFDGILEYVRFGIKYFKPDIDTIVTIIDYTKPSTDVRLWIVNPNTGQIIDSSLVAHGRGSGDNRAVRFSNRPRSQMSSPGFFLTGKTYYGSHGYSLLLYGLEPGINDKAFERKIVIHPAWYVTSEFAKKYGRLGRSWGCPALPPDKSARIIDRIKNGTLLYIHTTDTNYFSSSEVYRAFKRSARTTFADQ